ncbi:MAG TPA: PQQ-binding-like beta-propeller repeat protein [Ignavibacteriaceae bacterium]|nr:PQQ-binding-like beta-propeller repeat protein [Ignavibacteriaceae bacterium]
MGLLKYKIFFLVVILLISGCARSVIKYATKLDENPYQMYGKIPSREFYLPANISDSLVLKWESEANGSFPNSSVSVYEDLVFINDLSGRIFCFNIESGKKIGSLKYSSGSVYSTPIPYRSKIIFPVALEKDNLTELIIYDYAQGKEMEAIELPGRVLTQMIAVGDEILFTSEVGIAYRFNSMGKKIWETHTRVPTRSSPAFVNDLFIFGNDEGEIIALNSSSGDSVYVQNIGGHFFSGLTISENVIYAGNDNGFIYALNVEDGEIIWQFDTGARIKMEPAVDGQNIYIGNLNSNFYSLNKLNGNENWRTDFHGILNTTPLITENMIILPNVLFEIHLLNKQSGEVIKSIPLDGRAKLSPVIHRNILFIGYDDGVIRAYEFVY